jgi:ABC-type lipoprotein export system ATPase subunit
VSFSFGTREILRQVSLEIHEGTFTTIMGPSGAGKSTMLSILGGLTQPAQGSVRGPAPNQIAWVAQTAVVHRRRSVLDNVAIGAYRISTSVAMARKHARTALEAVGLASLADQLAGSCSGGEQQRICLARALAGQSRLILADEPTASLDRASVLDIAGCLAAVAAAGVAVVTASHDPSVAALAERSWELVDGKISPVGAP